MRLLFIGDVYGAPGLSVTQAYLRQHRHGYDLIVANGENCAGGFGITRKDFAALRAAGVDVVTLGNHSFDHADAAQLLEEIGRAHV